MPPAASFEFRVPSNYKEQPQPQPSSSPYCQYPSNLSNPNFSKFECDSASGVGNGIERCGVLFNSGRSVPGSTVRSKPRLNKVRKGSASRMSRSLAASTSVDSGFNPFQSGSQSSDQLKDDSGRTSGFASSTKISASSGESLRFGFIFGVNSSFGNSNSNSSNTDTKERGANFNRMGNAFDPATGEVGRTDGKLRFNDAESLRDGVPSLSGLSFGIGKPCNEEKVETGGNRENVMFDKNDFVFGTGWFDGSMKSEGQRATSGSEHGTTEDKGGQFQNCVHSSFVVGAMSNNLGLNSTNCVGKQTSDDKQSSSHLNQASFVFVAGEPTTSSGVYAGERKDCFSACFVDCSSNDEVKEKVKPDSERHGKRGSMPGDDGSHSVGNDHWGKEELSNRAGQPFPCDMQKKGADIGSRCQFDNGGSFDSNEGQENNYFVFRSGNESYSSRRIAEAKMSNQVNVESCAHRVSISGDRWSTMNMSSFGKPSDVKLTEDLKKLNINNLQKVENAHFCSTRAPDNANHTFVFKSSTPDSISSTGRMSTSDKMDKEVAGNRKDPGVELNNGASVRPVDENLFVFSVGASSCSSFSGVSSHCSATYQFSQSPENSKGKFKGDVDPSSFPPFGLGTTTKCGTYAASEEEREVESIGLGSSSMDFKVQCDTFKFSANTYNTLDRKSEHGVKTRTFRDVKSKKTRGKARKHDILKQKSLQETESGKSSPHINTESAECYSPMDFSPYEESIVTEQCSQEGSVKLNPLPFAEVNCSPLGKSHISTDSKDVNFAAAYADSQSKLFSGVDVASGDARTGAYSNASPQQNDRSQYQFASNSGTRTEAEQFMFTAPSSAHAHPLPIKRQRKKKYRMKAGVSAGTSAVCASYLGSTITLTDKKQVENGPMSSESKVKHRTMTDEEGPTSTLSASEEACEKWKLRGNQAYKNGELHKAEDCYTSGINCIPSGEASPFPVKPLVLCYSNRAATRMALGRVREALQDCLMAVTLDPGFLKAQIRAANCHLMLGELEEATQNFSKCMESGSNICLDRQLVIAASDGLQKTQKVADYSSNAEELLKLKTSEAAVTALESIAVGMSISLYSENLLKLKAEALCLLQKYEDAVQLCEHTLDFAEKNFLLVSSNNPNMDGSDVKTNLNVRLWRLHVLAKCYFHLGRLETALGLLQKSERNSQDSDPLVVTIAELLKHKDAGNEAFRSGKHAEAVEYYTSAITCSIESRPFAAVCFCNRAAAYQVLGQIADAISDCSVAIALDENYVKAVSRRANLHEKIRDYKQAASDLQKLVSIIQKQSHGKAKQAGSSSNEKELEQAHRRLLSMEEHAKKEISLDLYLILGIKQDDSASEIKKAYRKAALRHHPDKARQSVVRSESGGDGQLWKEIADLVHKDSDRLFKMIGEAYAVLSDPEKRAEYDEKEDMRSASRASNVNRGASRRETDFYGYTYSNYPFERSTNRREWQSGYRSRNSYTRW